MPFSGRADAAAPADLPVKPSLNPRKILAWLLTAFVLYAVSLCIGVAVARGIERLMAGW